MMALDSWWCAWRAAGRVLLLLLVAVAPTAGRALQPAPTWTTTSAPYANPHGAQWIEVDGTGGRKFLAAVLRPEGPGPFPVVVVLHGSSGLTARVLSVAEEVARAGFLVVCGCWQAGRASTEGTRICAGATPQAEWVADPAAHAGQELIAAARMLPGARADRLGLLGLSRGGHAALWAVSTGTRVQAVVVDAPAHVPNVQPRPPSPLTVLAGLDAPVLLLHGTADVVIPVEQSREYERAARALGKPLTAVYFEGAGHVTTVEPGSRVEARRRVIEFLKEKLAR